MAKLSKSDLITMVADETGQSKKDVKNVVDTLFVKIEAAIANGDAVTLQGFGRFYTREAKARVFRKINSTDIVNVGPRQLPKAKFSKKFIERVKN